MRINRRHAAVLLASLLAVSTSDSSSVATAEAPDAVIDRAARERSVILVQAGGTPNRPPENRLKLRAAADGRSVAQYVAVLIIDDLNRGKSRCCARATATESPRPTTSTCPLGC